MLDTLRSKTSFFNVLATRYVYFMHTGFTKEYRRLSLPGFQQGKDGEPLSQDALLNDEFSYEV